eukprot:m.17117 g.17117  ORF g.17117 m.17117 type:complete len:217 (-) comp5397_c0_seq1:21-671(-)
MIRLTMIARVIDGLPLCASMDEEADSGMAEYKSQAKMLFKKLSDTSPMRCSIETHGSNMFHYAIDEGVCYLVLADKTYPKKLAYGYIEELHQEFFAKHGTEVRNAARPYAFISFDTFIQKTKRSYSDTRGAERNISKLTDELQDVQRIMIKNIDEVLARGEHLDAMASKTASLRDHSSKYRKDAEYLRLQALIRAWGPVVAVCLIVALFVYIYYLY